MLTRIILTNFKSFKNRTEVDFRKTNYTILPQNVADNDILKGAVFVGANASGKSNLVLAIRLLLDFLFKEKSINSGLFPCLFGNKPSFSIEYHYLIDNSEIEYYVEIDIHKSFIIEKLRCSDVLMLERMGESAKSYVVDPNGISYDESDVAKDTLFLRTLYFNTKFSNNTILSNWMKFLEKSVYVNLFESQIYSYGKEKMGIQAFLNREGCDRINNFFKSFSFGQAIEYAHKVEGSSYAIIAGENEDDKLITFRRTGLGEPIPFNEESCGNQTLLRLLPAYLSVISDGGMLLIDEFSSGFHNELEELLIKYFMLKSNYAQIFFVSHSTNLLSNSILRPDQEFAISFCGYEGSKINRFSSQQPRNAQNIEKMYNSGIFGGLPNYEERIYEDQ